MREYHMMMLRTHLYPGGRVHHDPERQTPAAPKWPAVSARSRMRRRGSIVVLGGVLLATLLAF